MKELAWIDSQDSNMRSLVESWASINTSSFNFKGLGAFRKKLQRAFAVLKPDTAQSSDSVLLLRKRTRAPLRLLLGGHLDTVFGVDHPFQQVTRQGKERLCGPGVADMKGGLVILLFALTAFERSKGASEIGWDVCLNSDEEIGSPRSTPIFQRCAKRCDAALLFEPSLPDGSLVSSRKGSTNLTVHSQGKAAHAGRHPEKGRNALIPLARWIAAADTLNDHKKGISINIARIEGGGAVNIVPENAIAHVNVRTRTEREQERILHTLSQFANNQKLKIKYILSRPPKPFDAQTRTLFDGLKKCGKALGLSLRWKESGGVCDGNTIAAMGTPTIDTLGVRGGHIHTEEEYLELPSLAERAKLTALFLIHFKELYAQSC